MGIFKRAMSHENKWRGIAFAVCMCAFVLSVFFLIMAETDTEETVCSVIAGVSVLCAIWLDGSRKSLLSGIISTVSVLMFAFPRVFGSSKVFFAVFTAWIWLLIGYVIVFAIIKRTVSLMDIPFMATLTFAFQFLMLVSLGSRFSYIESESIGFPFLVADIIGALLVAALVGVLLFTGVIKLKQDKAVERVSLVFMTALLVLLFADFSLRNINYAFDTSEPALISAVVDNKRKSSSRKGPDNYYLIVTVDGKELDLDVSLSEFQNTEVGDTVGIKKYNGAFNKPFFMPDINNSEE